MTQECGTCRHYGALGNDNPCLSCSYSNWQPTDDAIEAAIKAVCADEAPDMINHQPHWQAADAPVAETPRASILREAERIVTQDRNAAYGEPEDCFSDIAAGWNWWLSIRQPGALRSHDIAVMMTMLKLARINANPAKQDSWVDAAGYIACGAEIALKEPRAIITDAYNEAIECNS